MPSSSRLARPAVLPGSTVERDTPRWAPGDFSGAPRLSPRDAADAREQAARAAAAQARAELARQIEEARAAGYADGYADGAASEADRLRSGVAAAAAMLARLQEGESHWQTNVTENIAALAVAVACHVIGRELRGDAATVADLVRRALAEFPIDQPMRVRVHPADLALLSHAVPDGEALAIAPNRDVHWMADGRVTPGGCVVEGRERIIDGRVDTALERVYRRLSAVDA